MCHVHIPLSGKDRINISNIASLNQLSYGSFDSHHCLDENKIGYPTLVYDPNKLARGIEIYHDLNQLQLHLSLPTSPKEIQLFYSLIQNICLYLDKNQFYRNNQLHTLHDLNSLESNDLSKSKELLKEIQHQLHLHPDSCFMIHGIMNPISLGYYEMDEINGSLEVLELLLDKLQKLDVFYAHPYIYKKKDNSLFGGYFIGENISLIVPNHPNMTCDNQFIQDWYAFFPDNKLLNYDFFIQHVSSVYYDFNHKIVHLSRKDINELFDLHYDELNPD